MKAAVLEELRQLHESQPDGVLRAETVVAYAAAHPTSPLHEQFEWDDSQAAARYRLMQARQLLRVAVTILPNIDEPIRAYISLREDRHPGTGGGYRSTLDVLGDADRRARFLEEARDDLVRIQAKYRVLAALIPRFAQAMEEAVAAVNPSTGAPTAPAATAAP